MKQKRFTDTQHQGQLSINNLVKPNHPEIPYVVGPKHFTIENRLRRQQGNPDWKLVGESLWFVSPKGKTPLAAPPLNEENPFYLDRFAISPNQDFIFGARKVCAGDSEMFLWVRQHDRSYKLLPETVNDWIVRRRGEAHKGSDIWFVRLVRWIDGGNGVVLAGLYNTGKHNYWHLQPIDLVQGRFGPDQVIGMQKLTFLI